MNKEDLTDLIKLLGEALIAINNDWVERGGCEGNEDLNKQADEALNAYGEYVFRNKES